MIRTIYSIVLILLISLTGCKDEIQSVDDKIIPDSKIDYYSHIQPVLNYHCTSCHNEEQAEGGVMLTTYSKTTANFDVVFPGKPENSKLIWVIDPAYGFNPMPPIGSPFRPLNSNQINGIRTWIKEGAKQKP